MRKKFSIRKVSLYLLCCIGIFYLAAIALLYVNQRELQYPLTVERASVDSAHIPKLEERSLTTKDGERILAWHVPPRANKFVLVYFPGNAHNLSDKERLFRFRALTADGTGLLALSYRGYGGSTGKPTEAGLHLDALAAYEEARRLYGADRLIAYGESLGTGVAVRLAVEQKLKAVILEGPYTSAADVGQKRYWFAPVKLVMLDPFHSDDIIGRLHVPLLILHGEQDGVIPVAQGRELYKLAPVPKRLVIFENGHHTDLHHHGATAAVRDFLSDVQSGNMTGEQMKLVN